MIDRFLKIFGSCLPGKKGKGSEDVVLNSSQVDPKQTTEEDEKKNDIDEASDAVEKEKEGLKPTPEISVPVSASSGENNVVKEPEEVGGPEAKEPTSSSEETLKTEEEPSPTNEGHESNESFPVDENDAQDEEYPWQVACCGVEVPMGK